MHVRYKHNYAFVCMYIHKHVHAYAYACMYNYYVCMYSESSFIRIFSIPPLELPGLGNDCSIKVIC